MNISTIISFRPEKYTELFNTFTGTETKVKQYIKNLIPRLQQFSKNLDRMELFMDKPWVVEDEYGNRHMHIFQRDHTLIVSTNGRAEVGKWSYVPATNGLLINLDNSKFLLNQAFVEEGLMVMKLDGNIDRPWLLINEKVIPDLDAERYLKEFTIRKLQLKQIIVGENTYFYADPDGNGINSKTIFLDSSFRQTGVNINFSTSGLKYQVENGVVVHSYHPLTVNTDKGTLHTRSKFSTLSLGDPIFSNEYPAPSGEYKIIGNPDCKRMTVTNGCIASLEEKVNSGLVLVMTFFLIVIIGVVVLTTRTNSRSNDTSAQADTTYTTSSEINYNDSSSSGTYTSGSIYPAEAIPIATWAYSDDQAKDRVAAFLDGLNRRDFISLYDFFPAVVPKYFKDRNKPNSEIVENIKTYWSQTLSKGFTTYKPMDMVAGREADHYFVELPQLQLSTNQSDGVPRYYRSNVKYLLDQDLKIISVTGVIIDQGNDIGQLFGLQENDYRSFEEFVKTASSTDFDRLFQRLASNYETAEYKQALKAAVMENFGADTPVNVYSSTQYLTLESFCDGLISGTYKYPSTKSIDRSSMDQIIQLTVSYLSQ